MKRKYIVLFILSALLWGILVPLGSFLGGYGGHHIKLLFASFLYCLITFVFLKRANNKMEVIYVLIIIAAFPILIYTPLYFHRFNNKLISLPSSLAHLYGICFGALLVYAKRAWKILILFILISTTIWMATFGYRYWLNYLSFGVLNGKLNKTAPVFKFYDEKGNIISNKNLNNQFVILDFWSTSCGVCFQKFPSFQQFYLKHKNSPFIKIYAVNWQSKQDSTGQAFATIKKLGYTFPVLISTDSIIKQFQIISVPTIIVINPQGDLIFKGRLEDIDKVLKDFK